MKMEAPMTLRQLQYFRVLAQIKHYTHAAEILVISQPSLSTTISDLEKELGVPLFEKIGKRVALSLYGELFYEYVNQSLDTLENGKKALKQLVSSQKHKITVGCLHTLSFSLVNPIIDKFYEEGFSDSVKIENIISNSNQKLLDMLISEEIDLAFCLELSSKLEGKPIFHQEMFAIVSKKHPLGIKEEILFEEIQNEPMVVVKPGARFNLPVEKAFEQFKATPNIAFKADDFNVAFAYILLENSFMISPVLPSIDLSKLSVLRIKNANLCRPIYLAWKIDRPFSESAKIFCDFVCSHYDLIKNEGS